MNVVSYFDGMSCGQLALQREGIKVTNYFACEIDKYSSQVTMNNFPHTKQLGDVTKINLETLPKPDLFIGGSPCQGFSFAGKQLNFNDPRSRLFFEFASDLRYIQEFINPDIKFLLENVKMKKEYQDVISKFLGVQPVEINSALVSAQNRKRLYWTNICEITQPEDRYIYLKDIVLSNTVPVSLSNIYGGFKESGCRTHTDKSPTLRANSGGGSIPSFVDLNKLILSDKAIQYMNRKVKGGRNHWDFKHHSDVDNEKAAAVVANLFKGVPYNVLKDFNCIRHYHPIECERLQNIPDNYTEGVSNSQRLKMLGNGWTVDVIAHIFKSLQNNEFSGDYNF